MYLSHFGLKEQPFNIAPDVDFFYHQASRKSSVSNLKNAIDRGEGIIKVVGAIGSGKTTLLNLLSSSLPGGYEVLTITMPNLTPYDLLLHICKLLNVPAISGFKPNITDLIEACLYALQCIYDEGRKAILLIDESQLISFDTLEQIRLLSNLQSGKHRLVQIIMFGQNEFDENLKANSAKPFLSRVSSSIELDKFNVEEVKSYLNHRMQYAGYRGQDLFPDKVAKLIYKQSNGLPRGINLIADQLLQTVFENREYSISIKNLRTVGLRPKLNNAFVFVLMTLVLSMIAVFSFQGRIVDALSSFSENVDNLKVDKKESIDLNVLSALSRNKLVDLNLFMLTNVLYEGNLFKFMQLIEEDHKLAVLLSQPDTILLLDVSSDTIVLFSGASFNARTLVPIAGFPLAKKIYISDVLVRFDLLTSIRGGI